MLAIPARRIFFHQAVLQGGKQPLDASFWPGALCGDPFDPQFCGARPNCEWAASPQEVFADGCRTVATENAIFIRVMGQGTPVQRRNHPPNVRRFCSVVSCSTNCAWIRLVASSITAINWQAGPRSSSQQRKGELSAITNSPKLALRSAKRGSFHAGGADPEGRLGSSSSARSRGSSPTLPGPSARRPAWVRSHRIALTHTSQNFRAGRKEFRFEGRPRNP